MVDYPENQKENDANTLPPFVENNDSSHLIAAAYAQRLRQRWRLNPSLYMNNTPILPLADGVHYVDFGFTSAREYWTEVAEPAYERLVKDETRGNAIAAFLLLAPLPDWLWHERHPGKDTRKSKDYEPFRQQLFSDCPELALLRDVADAGKHRFLGRPNVQVTEVAKSWPSNMQPLKIGLKNGTEHNIVDVLSRIV